LTGRVFSKLLFAFVLVLFIGTAILDFSIRRIADYTLRQQIEQNLTREARLLGAQLSRDQGAMNQSLVQAAADATNAEITIFHQDGSVFHSSDSLADPADIAQTPELATVALRHAPSGKATRDKTLFVAVPAGEFLVRIAYPLTEIRTKLQILRRDILLASLVSLLLATLLAAFFARRVAQRLRRIVVFAERIAAGDLTARVEEGQLDEISAVAHALDTTASRLETTFDSLESSRSELTALLDSMQEGVIAVTATGQVSWSNTIATRIARQPIREGRALVQTIRDPEILKCVGTALVTRQVTRGRATSLYPGRVFEVNAGPTPGGGAVVVLHEVTEIERAETMRRDFVANVSHELRTPLTSIRGYLELLLDGGLDAEQRSYLGIIDRNSNRLLGLVSDLLLLTQIEAGELVFDFVPVDLEEIVQECIETSSPAAETNDIQLVMSTERVPLVLGHRVRLAQVLDNLISNALKFTPSGGQVDVRLSAVDGAVVIEVQDTGLGVSEDDQPQLFDRFFRSSQATKNQIPGSGLGLTISKAIIERHGGRIELESSEGVGTTVRVRLPLSSEKLLRAARALAA
jgi:two-component system phosphate regulon sensor histidine kinase PhoR